MWLTCDDEDLKKVRSSFQDSKYPSMQEYSTLRGWTTANSPTWMPDRMLSHSSSQVDRMAIRDAGGDLNTRSNCKNHLKILPITKPDNILYMTKQRKWTRNHCICATRRSQMTYRHGSSLSSSDLLLSPSPSHSGSWGMTLHWQEESTFIFYTLPYMSGDYVQMPAGAQVFRINITLYIRNPHFSNMW